MWKGESFEHSLNTRDFEADFLALATLEEVVDRHLLVMCYIKENDLLTPELQVCINDLTKLISEIETSAERSKSQVT